MMSCSRHIIFRYMGCLGEATMSAFFTCMANESVFYQQVRPNIAPPQFGYTAIASSEVSNIVVHFGVKSLRKDVVCNVVQLDVHFCFAHILLAQI